MFLMPLLKNKKDFGKISLIAMSCSIFFLVFISTILLLAFPFITNSDEIMSVYLLVRTLKFGEFLERTDALFIFLWILSAMSYLSITLMFILNIFKKLTNIKSSKQMSFSFTSILFTFVLLLNNQYIIDILDSTVYKYFVLILVFGISIIILLLANLKKKISKNKSSIKS